MMTGLITALAVVAVLGILIFIGSGILPKMLVKIPADPNTIGINFVSGRRSQKDRKGEYGIFYEGRSLLPRWILRVYFAGITPGRVLHHGWWFVLPWLQRVDTVSLLVRNLDLRRVTFPTADDINTPFDFSIDWAPDISLIRREGRKKIKGKTVGIFRRIFLYLDRRTDDGDEKPIVDKLEDVMTQSIKVWASRNTLDGCLDADEKDLLQFFMPELTVVKKQDLQGLSEEKWEKMLLKWKEEGMPDRFGLGIRIFRVTMADIDIPEIIVQSLAQARMTVGEIKETLTAAIAAGEINLASLVDENGNPVDIDKEINTVEDIRKLAEKKVKIPWERLMERKRLAEVHAGHGQIIDLRGLEIIEKLVRLFKGGDKR